MKIICVGRNYAAHAKEMSSDVPTEPVIFMKPDTALHRDTQPFYLPELNSSIHHEIEVVLKINREGKHIAEKFAGTYFDEIAVGIDLTARDLQAKLKKAGLPWELSKAFDSSAITGKFFPKQQFENLADLNFELEINGTPVQQGNTKDLIFSFDFLISYISRFITLRKGDLIFTGTPEGVGPIHIADRLKGSLAGFECFEILVK